MYDMFPTMLILHCKYLQILCNFIQQSKMGVTTVRPPSKGKRRAINPNLLNRTDQYVASCTEVLSVADAVDCRTCNVALLTSTVQQPFTEM